MVSLKEYLAEQRTVTRWFIMLISLVLLLAGAAVMIVLFMAIGKI
jgi:hypothetical protein